MSKILSAKYYQENKERLPEKLVKDIKIFLKMKTQKSNNMVVNVLQTYDEKLKNKMKNKNMKNKSLLSIEKNIE